MYMVLALLGCAAIPVIRPLYMAGELIEPLSGAGPMEVQVEGLIAATLAANRATDAAESDTAGASSGVQGVA
jgi:hypothetical protein